MLLNKIAWWVVDKLVGTKAREVNRATEVMIKGYKELYEEQRKRIEYYQKKHPGNGVEYQEWIKREEQLMLQLVAKSKEILFWKERAIFLERENELLHIRLEKTRK